MCAYPGPGRSASVKVELKISCNLPKFDKMSKTDPKVFIFIEKREFSNNTINSLWSLVDSTEVIKDNNNPVFKKSFVIDYYFELIQHLRFMVMDMDSKSDEWAKNDFIGYVDVTLASIINRCEDHVFSCDLLTSVPSGIKVNNSKAKSCPDTSKIFIRIDDTESKYKLNFDISGKNLDKKDTFGKSDPFIIMSRVEDNGSMFKIYQTPVIKNTLDPHWESFEMPEKDFNKGDPNKEIYFEVYDWDSNTKNDLIGTFKATTKELLEKKNFEIINEKHKEKKGSAYKNSGIITFNIEKIRTAPYTFVEFPANGTEMAISFAIDFTGSNGLQHLPDSLHYNKPDYDINNFYTLNDYEKAISSIGYVLEPYDTNKLIEVYGYGGKFFGSKTVDFDCALNGNPNNPSVQGVAGVLNVYHETLKTVYLSGPTNFAPIIKKITAEARSTLPPPNKNNPLSKYFILTIITDGVISDMDKTKEAIIDACDVPLSIIIIGVGEKQKFEKMKELDDDDGKLQVKNKSSKRDIVQFLPLNDFIENPQLLAAETLKEVPKQLLEFVEKYKYRPKNE